MCLQWLKEIISLKVQLFNTKHWIIPFIHIIYTPSHLNTCKHQTIIPFPSKTSSTKRVITLTTSDEQTSFTFQRNNQTFMGKRRKWSLICVTLTLMCTKHCIFGTFRSSVKKIHKRITRVARMNTRTSTHWDTTLLHKAFSCEILRFCKIEIQGFSIDATNCFTVEQCSDILCKFSSF